MSTQLIKPNYLKQLLPTFDRFLQSDNQGFADCFIFLLDSFFTDACLSGMVCRALMTLLILSLTSSLMNWLNLYFQGQLKINLYQNGKSCGNILFLGIEEAGFLLCSKQVGDP